MGNSLQDYRCKICSFLNNRSGLKIKSSKYQNVKNKSGSSKFSPIFLLIFSVVCILTTPDYLSYSAHQLKPSFPSGWSDLHLPSSVEIVNNNFESRYKYGNKQKNGLKIMHWNAGGKYLVNKVNDIESL